MKVNKRRILKNGTPYFMLIPAAVFLFLFLAYPLFYVFRLSMENYNVARLAQRGFIGFQNFVDIFTKDKVFYQSLEISVKWVLWEVTAQLLLGFWLALLLDKTFKGRGIARCLVFLPWAMSGVITAMIWSLMYNQNIGILNDLFRKLGFIQKDMAWLANSKTALASCIVAEIWRGIPFFAITLLASLQNIPPELYEACRADGGKPWHEIMYIKLPFLKNTIILTTLLRAVWEFNNVDLLLTLTGGGPSNKTMTMTMYMTNMAVKNNNYGYGAALAVIAFFILLLFALVYLKLSSFGKEE